MLKNGIKLTTNGYDTLRPLDIYLKPFANIVRDIKYYKRCSMFVIP